MKHKTPKLVLYTLLGCRNKDCIHYVNGKWGFECYCEPWLKIHRCENYASSGGSATVQEEMQGGGLTTTVENLSTAPQDSRVADCTPSGKPALENQKEKCPKCGTELSTKPNKHCPICEPYSQTFVFREPAQNPAIPKDRRMRDGRVGDY